MSNLNSINQWTYNCPPGKNDLDAMATWGNNGTLTLQRPGLRKIRYNMRFCNTVDGWIEKEKTIELPSPTSDPYTLTGVSLGHSFAKGKANEYFSKRYKFETVLLIYSGQGEVIEVEDHTTETSGCLRRHDPNYANLFGCTPPDVECEPETETCR